MDQKINKWYRWVGSVEDKNSIAYEMANLSHRRRIYQGVRKMINENHSLKNTPSAFYNYFARTYSDSALLAIRRHVKPQKDSKALIMLVKDIRDNAKLITIDFYKDLYNEPELGEKDFRNYYAGTNGKYLDSKKIEGKLEKLHKVIKLTESFTDRRIAHLDKREPTYIPTYSEIDECCDLLFEVFKSIYNLLHAAEIRLVPILKHNWKNIFKEAWINTD